MACWRDHTEVALELLKVDGLDVNVQDSYGNTALMIACWREHTGVVTELLKEKVDGLDVNLSDKHGNTALLIACSRGLTDVATELLKMNGLDVNNQNSDRSTALIEACINCHTGTAMALLRDRKVKRHIKHLDGRNALYWARDKGLSAVVTRFEDLARGDERIELAKVHYRYLHGDTEGAQAPHSPGSAITKVFVDKNLMLFISRFLAT